MTGPCWPPHCAGWLRKLDGAWIQVIAGGRRYDGAAWDAIANGTWP